MLVAALFSCLPTSSVIARDTACMFTPDQFAHLTFLEGRWEGTGPDGKPFFEQYSFESGERMRSGRYADATFAEETDHSVVALAEGRIVSTWNDFTWEASELAAGKACFTPINEPSAFCWTRTSDATVEVTQRWTDEHGADQTYVVLLRRLLRDAVADKHCDASQARGPQDRSCRFHAATLVIGTMPLPAAHRGNVPATACAPDPTCLACGRCYRSRTKSRMEHRQQ